MNIEIVLLIIIAVLVLLDKAYKLSTEKRIKQNVNYCVTESLGVLISKLNQVLPAEHRISAEDEHSAHQILEAYRGDMLLCHIKDGYTRKSASLSCRDFFMRTLYIYLDERCCSCTIEEQTITEYVEAVNGYTSLYSLTDFGVVFYKVFLATALYNQKSGYSFTNPAFIYDALDTHKIKVMRYRP